MILDRLPRPVWFWWQRRTRGFDDSETWSLEYTFVKWALPRLKRFKQVTIAYPGDMTAESWDEALDTMIEGFALLAESDSGMWPIGEDEERLQKAIDLWHDRFWSLWW